MRALTNKNKKMIQLLLMYTVLFIFVFLLCYVRQYAIANKSFIWEVDGFEHEYTTFVYIHNYVHSVGRNLFINHKFEIPLWDYNIGYGSDIFSTLVLGTFDILKIVIASLCPLFLLEKAFCFLISFKFFLVGISFIFYSKYKKKDDIATLLGALIYTFSITTSVGLAHGAFLDAYIYLPIVYVGVNQLWENKKSTIYCLTMVLLFADNYYFGYMVLMGIFFYCIQRYVLYGYLEKKNIHSFIKVFWLFFTRSILSIGIAAIAFFPGLLKTIDADRLDIKHNISFFYDYQYYQAIWQGFIDAYDSANDWYLGFSAITLVFVLAFFICGNKHNLLKLSFIEMTIGICCPIIGRLMNGFGYASNRWVFMYLFCCACIVTTFYDDYVKGNILLNHQCFLLIFLVFLYGITFILLYKNFNERFVIPFVLALTFSVFFAFFFNRKYGENIVLTKFAMVTICVISLFVSLFYHYNYETNYHINTSVVKGEANNLLEMSNAQSLLSKVSSEDGFRYSSSNVFYKRNASWALRNAHSCMDMYLNVYDNNIDKMNKNLAVLTDPFSFSYHGVDRRSELEMLYGVKYHIVKDGEEQLRPFGYDKIYNKDSAFGVNYSVFQAPDNISMAYVFDKATDLSDYKNLNPLSKQDVLMNSVVIEGIDEKDYCKLENIENYEVDFSIDEQSTIKLDFDNTFVSSNENQLILNVNKVENGSGEWCIFFKNYQNVGNVNTQFFTSVDVYDEDDVLCGQTSFNSLTEKSTMYGQKHDWLLNFGRLNNCDHFVITIYDEGTYSFDDIQVLFKPEDVILENINSMDKAGNLVLLNNKMSIETDTDKDKWLFVSQPYSNGWHAFVDNHETTIYKADDAFMSIKLPEGKHSIEFRYFNPNLKIAIIISFCSFCALLFLVCNNRKYIKIQEKS